MRLWHYKLIPYLPKSQLLAQWRELNSIYKKQDRHILINYICVYEGNVDLYAYSLIVMREMIKRGYNIKSMVNFRNYFGLGIWDNQSQVQPWEVKESNFEPFKNHHTEQYLVQCYFNLQEKYHRAQKDFSQEQFQALKKFVIHEVGHYLYLG